MKKYFRNSIKITLRVKCKMWKVIKIAEKDYYNIQLNENDLKTDFDDGEDFIIENLDEYHIKNHGISDEIIYNVVGDKISKEIPKIKPIDKKPQLNLNYKKEIPSPNTTSMFWINYTYF